MLMAPIANTIINLVLLLHRLSSLGEYVRTVHPSEQESLVLDLFVLHRLLAATTAWWEDVVQRGDTPTPD